MALEFETSCQSQSQGDPLRGTLLLPRTLQGLQISQPIDDFLRSKALKDPHALLEQASAVLKFVSEGLESDISHLPPPKDDNGEANVLVGQENEIPESNLEVVELGHSTEIPPKDDNVEALESGAEHPRRRPALGRKHAKFSFKLRQSESISNVDLSLDIDNLQDPEEFFRAHERIENAEKELRKLRGHSVDDPIQQNAGTILHRPRRPGLLGKTVSYKHLYPPTSDNKENILQSQEEKSSGKVPSSATAICDTFSSTISHPKAGQPGKPKERELTEDKYLMDAQTKDSIAEATNQVSAVLDELFSCKDLDESEMVSFLQERLHVKPVTMDRISLPDLGFAQSVELRASQEAPPKPRKPLSDVQHDVLQLRKLKSSILLKTPAKKNKNAENSGCSLDSTPLRSPFATLSLLRKQILQADVLENPFDLSSHARGLASEQPSSVHKEVLSPPLSTSDLPMGTLAAAGTSVTPEADGKCSTLDVNLLPKVLPEGDVIDGAVSSGKSSRIDFACPSNKSAGEFASGFNGDMTFLETAEFKAVSSKAISGEQRKVDSACASEIIHLFDEGVNITSVADCIVKGNEDKARQHLLQESSYPFLEAMDEMTDQVDHDVNIASKGLESCLQGKEKDMPLEALLNPDPMDEIIDRVDNDTSIASNGLESCLQDKVKDMLSEAFVDAEPMQNLQGDCFLTNEQQCRNLDIGRELSYKELQVPCIASPNAQEKQDAPPTMQSEAPPPKRGKQAAQLQRKSLAASASAQGKRKVPQNVQSEEAPPQKRGKRETRLLRDSLAGAGTLLEAGVRRSTRIRSRPLEYWKGERFLYGRIHDSLPTVIGMKYASPASKSAGLKVKSYVPEEFAELLELAARH